MAAKKVKVPLDMRLRWDYEELKRKIALLYTIWFIALVGGLSLIIASEFLNNTPLKYWSIFIATMIFVKVAYDIKLRTKVAYQQYYDDHNQNPPKDFIVPPPL